MRCLLRNAAGMLALLWSGAAAAVAGPVSIRTSAAATATADPHPAAIVQADVYLSEGAIVWFGETLQVQPIAVTGSGVQRPAAIMIPLPAPIWLGMGALSGVFIVARVFNPWRIHTKENHGLKTRGT